MDSRSRVIGQLTTVTPQGNDPSKVGILDGEKVL
jgi:hypothetical protein